MKFYYITASGEVRFSGFTGLKIDSNNISGKNFFLNQLKIELDTQVAMSEQDGWMLLG